MVSGGKEKIFDGNGGRNWWMRKKVEKKKKKGMTGICVYHVRKFTK